MNPPTPCEGIDLQCSVERRRRGGGEGEKSRTVGYEGEGREEEARKQEKKFEWTELFFFFGMDMYNRERGGGGVSFFLLHAS